MSRFVYDRIFILLPGQEVPEQTVAEAIDSANKVAEHAHNLIKIESYPSTVEIYRETQGNFYTTGLIPHWPKGEMVARFGVAWFTDSTNKKHIRLASDVIKVQIHTDTNFWCQYEFAPSLVYPGLEVTHEGMIIKCRCGKSGRFEEMGWDGKCCWVCQEHKRYEMETGFRKIC